MHYFKNKMMMKKVSYIEEQLSKPILHFEWKPNKYSCKRFDLDLEKALFLYVVVSLGIL